MKKVYLTRVVGTSALALIFVMGTLSIAEAQLMATPTPTTGAGNLVQDFGLYNQLSTVGQKISGSILSGSGVSGAGIAALGDVNTRNAQTNFADRQARALASQQMDINSKHQAPSDYSYCKVAAPVSAQQKVGDDLAGMEKQVVNAGAQGGIYGPSQAAQFAKYDAQNCESTGPLAAMCQKVSAMLLEPGSNQFSSNEHGTRGNPAINLVSLTSGSGMGARQKSASNPNLQGGISTVSAGGGAGSGKPDSMDAVCGKAGIDMPSDYSAQSKFQPPTGSDDWSMGYRYCQSLALNISVPSGQGVSVYQYEWYKSQIASGSAAYSACMHELMMRTRPNDNFAAKKTLNDAAQKQVDGNFADTAGSVSAMELFQRASGISGSENWQKTGSKALLASDKPNDDRKGAYDAAKFTATHQDECRKNITTAIGVTKNVEEIVAQKEHSDLEELKITAIEEQSKKQTAMLNDTLQKLTNQMQQLQAAIKSPDSKVPVSYTHKVSTQVEN